MVAPRHRYTYRDYLLLEESSNVKHEFFDGEIYAMAGGTPEHAAICARIISALTQGLAGRDCEVYTSDLRVRVQATGLASYPDVTVVCGPLERDPEDRNTVINPTVLIEVLSDGTESYDRTEKLEHYRRLPSLRACVLVSHRERLVEIWNRDEQATWKRQEARGRSLLAIQAVGTSLDLDAIYDGLSVPTSPSGS
jgi:Uma2 family endonuclease